MIKDTVTPEEVRHALENGIHLQVNNQISILPDWSDFIGNIDTAIRENPKKSGGDTFEQIGNVMFYDSLTIRINHSQNYPYTGLKEMKKYIEDLGLEIVRAYSFMNFSSLQKTSGEHEDDIAIVYFQCVNSAKWITYSRNNDNSRDSKEFILNPGDIMFSPRKVFHEVIPDMPRAAISFSVKFPDSN